MITKDFFNTEAALLWTPVFFIGGIVMRLAYTTLSEIFLPLTELEQEVDPRKGWIAEERRLLEGRRSDERRAAARAAYLRGDPAAPAMVGRRRSDYESLGLAYPVEKTL